MEEKKGTSPWVFIDAERVRMGIWFGPDSAPDTPVDEVDFSGTVADETEIQRFTSDFDVCSR